MADLSQITILPATQVQGPLQVTQGTTSHSANTALASLTVGTVLQGFIINRDASGNPILRTDKGDFPFSTSFFLKIGSEVVIRIGSTGGNVLAHLISVDGQPPEVAQNISAFSQDPEVILSPHLTQQQPVAAPASSTAAQAASDVVTTPAVTITGTVVSPPRASTPPAANTAAPAAPQTAAAPQPQPPGTQVTLKIVSLAPPAAASTPAAPGTATPPPVQGQAASALYATYARAAGQPAVAATPPAQAPATLAAQAPATPPQATATPPQATTAPAQPAANASTNAAATPAPVSQAPAATTSFVPGTAPAPPQAGAAPLPAAPAPTATPAPTAIATPPATTALPAAAATPPATTATAQQAAPAPIATPAATPAPPVPVTPSAPRPGTSPAIFTATVLASEHPGEQLVQTPVGMLRLPPHAALPAGSRVTFEVVETAPPPLQDITAVPVTGAPPAPLTELAQQWSSLQQIFALLTGRTTLTGLDEALTSPPATVAAGLPNDAHAAANVTAQTISTGLMEFIAALRKGDFNNWLGFSNTRLLQTMGQGELLKKAQAEFATMARQFTQAPPGHWQPLFFPVVAEGHIQQARLFVKRERKQGGGPGNRKKDESTRFVLEVDLSQLGEMQMDGFVHRQEKDLQFDMVIRSLNGLPQDMQDDISRIYNNMGEITGYKGSISFQNVREFPVNPMEDIVAGHDDFII